MALSELQWCVRRGPRLRDADRAEHRRRIRGGGAHRAIDQLDRQCPALTRVAHARASERRDRSLPLRVRRAQRLRRRLQVRVRVGERSFAAERDAPQQTDRVARHAFVAELPLAGLHRRASYESTDNTAKSRTWNDNRDIRESARSGRALTRGWTMRSSLKVLVVSGVLVACTPAPTVAPSPEVIIASGPASETAATFSAASSYGPATLVVNYNSSGGIFGSAWSEDGLVWHDCTQNNCGYGGGGIPIPTDPTQGVFRGDPAVAAGRPGSGIVMASNIADSATGRVNGLVVVVTSFDGGRTQGGSDPERVAFAA